MSTEVAISPDIRPSGNLAMGLIRPIAKPVELIALAREVHTLIQESLDLGVDYDVVPGTGSKPSLLKPGAEKLNLAFGTMPEYELIEAEVEHDREVPWVKRKKAWNRDKTFTWQTEEGISLGLYRYVVRCKIVKDGRVIASCIGICSSLESKYADRPRDCENTIAKMAQKRAFVGATLHAFGLSNRFTQDVEDLKPAEVEPVKPVANGIRITNEVKFVTYDDNNPGMQKDLGEKLRAMNVGPALWEDVGKAMHGKPKTLDTLNAAIKVATNSNFSDKDALRKALETEIDSYDSRGGSQETFRSLTMGKTYPDWIVTATPEDIMLLTDRLKKLPLQ